MWGLNSFHSEMPLFPMSCVLRGFSTFNVLDVRLGGNPCAAWLIEKTVHFQYGNSLEQS
jgi:hypothetical protein